ncbi:dual specificity protein phosphatase PHS1 [Phalaenopsis equestris]|uniref:dual specificity protein phosphatase PHS1 n=1 Tax=Phalaenopsis equestris TaxID=78828 RepID=UPI0009E26026|nr:dual specificity protein phosphatase PHS1 [Phalaenopsis equestris]XP_020593146.1 dual specificity protein phosphatase PHS1 [Phalaenopsis equestris]XP_020593147.1 dual specificity protein phosphatase PHS1 [Phalaenopsis equestris]
MSAFEKNGDESYSSRFSSTIITDPQECVGEKEQTLPSQVASFLWGEVVGTAQVFERWVALVRKRSGRCKPSGFPHRLAKTESISGGSLMEQKQSVTELISEELLDFADKSFLLEQAPERSLWERLGNAATMNVDSGAVTWSCLSSLHHTEHTSSNDNSEDELNKALEVTVNSGGVVFFALFNKPEDSILLPKEAAAVIKITSSRLTTLSECLGYEFARWLGVRTPQARVVHNFSPEWQIIKDAAEKACSGAASAGDEIGEMTCSELLEALEMSRCILLMNYVHGSPLLKNSQAFNSLEAAGSTAAALGRILLLDLIIRNEDRLPCNQLGWRGNPGNLLFVDKIDSAKLDALDEITGLPFKRYNPAVVKSLQNSRKVNSSNMQEHLYQSSDELYEKSNISIGEQANNAHQHSNFHVVAIDTGVPRRPPTGKRAKDQEQYPRLVELLLNCLDYSSNLLHEISGGKLGFSALEEADAILPCSSNFCSLSHTNMMTVVQKFRSGFRDALMDMQSFYIFLLTLNQKLDGLFRIFLSIVNKSSEDVEKEEYRHYCSPHSSDFGSSNPLWKERSANESHADSCDSETRRNTPRSSPRGESEHYGSPESTSSSSRGNWSGKYFKGSGDQSHRLRLTMKLRDFQKFVKADAEFNKDLEQWIEMLRIDVVKFCLENNFNAGFFDGNDSNIVTDAYELKVRLEHILDRMALISDAMNTERPSQVTDNLFIGGALAAKAVHTLQYLGITHIICLCLNEIGQSDSQHPEFFEYKNFSISDSDEEDISSLFAEACDFIATIVDSGGKVLVHCFEGKSRSATVVLAYLMMRNGLNLSESWNLLKKMHRRAQPNDGFAKALLELDLRLHGKVSMVWQHKKPVMKVCPICGKNAGLSTSSLKLHLQKSHRRISSGSVDSGLTLEALKVFDDLKISSPVNNPIQGKSRSLSPKF